jgi:hypothetical protein
MLCATEFGAEAQLHMYIVLTANGKYMVTMWNKSNIEY